MKRIDEIVGRGFPPLHLYLDEIRELIEFMSGISRHFDEGALGSITRDVIERGDAPPPESIAIQVGDYEISGLAEIANLPFKKSHQLRISRRHPSVMLDLSNYQASVRVGVGGPLGHGICQQLAEIVLRGEVRGWRTLVTKNWWKTCLGVAVFVNVAVGVVLSGSGLLARILATTFASCLVLVPLAVAGIRFEMRRYTTIELRTRSESPSFWERNRDQAALLVLGAVLGVAGTLAAQYLSKLLGISEK